MPRLIITKSDLVGKEALQGELNDLVTKNESQYRNRIKRLKKKILKFDERMEVLEREQPILLAHHRGTLMDTDPLDGRFNDNSQPPSLTDELRSKHKKSFTIDDLTSEKRKDSITYSYRIDDLMHKLGDPSTFNNEKNKHFSHYRYLRQQTLLNINQAKEKEEMTVLDMLHETQNTNAVELHTLSAALFELNTRKYEVLSTDIPQGDTSLRWRMAVADASSLKPGSLGRPCDDTMRKWHDMYLMNLSKKQAELCRACIPLIPGGEKVNLLAERYENEASILSSLHDNRRKRILQNLHARQKEQMSSEEAELENSFLQYYHLAKKTSIVPSLINLLNQDPYEGELPPIYI